MIWPQEFGEKYDNLCAKLDALTQALHEFPRNDQTHSKQMREWEEFVLIDGGQTDGAGAATIGGSGSNLLPAANGWEARIHRVVVTVGGASAAATVANYVGSADPQNLFDFASAMFGNTPSRVVGGYIDGIYSEQGRHTTIVIAGAVAAQQVTVRVTGRRRQT